MTKRKWLCLVLAVAMVFSLAACGNNDDKASSGTQASGGESSSTEAGSSEKTESSAESTSTAGGSATDLQLDDKSVYMITDLGGIDDKSFNEYTFKGVTAFCEANGVKANYLKPAGEGDQVYAQAIEQAIQAGAKIVVTPGFLFQSAIGEMQDKYPDVKFFAIDFEPTVPSLDDQGNPKKDEKGNVITETKISKNTLALTYKEEQAGFLAGYAAVKDGYTKLGFMGGMAVPAVINYGFGFVDGANYAAKEMGVKVEMKYNYTGSFQEKPEIQSMASSWYKSGTEIIFACGGGIYSSVLKAANAHDTYLIGVDSDQTVFDKRFITSAMKNLTKTTTDALNTLKDGTFKGGEHIYFGINEDGVQLSPDFSRFKQFKEDDYKAIYKKLQDNTDGITEHIHTMTDPAGDPTVFKDETPEINVEFIK